jgi:hypothetical protein
MNILYFPQYDGGPKRHYYDVYYMYIKNWAVDAGIKVIDLPRSRQVFCGARKAHFFSCLYNNQQIIFDFSNHKPFQYDPQSGLPYFKFHYSYDFPPHKQHKNVFPMIPQMMFRWEDFIGFRDNIQYRAIGDLVLNNQRPRAGALLRRTKAQKMLKDAYGKNVNTDYIDRNKWLLLHNDCLVSVAIPGAREDILDKGCVEEFGIGACVICPEITIVLPEYAILEKWRHYIPIKYDFSDLIEKVEWCKLHRNECVEVGRNCRKLFDGLFSPAAVWEWIEKCIGKNQ